MLLNSLNKQQKKAAEIINGPVMVFAGAGSGKTRTLTYRIANLINNAIKPQNILAITFTNKATNEMRERLFNLVGPEANKLTISTFHSFCARILRREIHLLNYSNQFLIIDDEDQLKVISEVINDLEVNKEFYSPRHMRRVINKAKCFGSTPDDKTEKKIFNAYEDRMHHDNLLDFEDLLIKFYDILKSFPEVRRRYQQKYQYILVDEFQDTNLIQYEIIKLLALKHRNIFVVGDDDQSIYSFRGTNYANMELFKDDFSEHALVILNQNYRSTQTILDACNNLIQNNHKREPKQLFSQVPGTSDDVVVHQANNELDEVDYVISEIKKLLKEGYTHKDIAILYRTSAISRNFELGFVKENLPYRVFGGISYLRRREVKDIIAYFRLIVFPEDNHSFKRIINTPARGIGQVSVDKFFQYKNEHKLTLEQTLNDVDKFLGSRKLAFSAFNKMINYFRQKINETDLVALYEELLEKTNYIEMLKDDDDKEERLNNLMEFKSILYSIENSGEIATRTEKLISSFDEAILSDDKFESQKHNHDGLTLSTIHSVKGLEFKAVFIVAFEDGVFPNRYRFDEDSDLEEERRIAYVGGTRAKNKLYLSTTLKRLLYGRTTYNPPSMFFLEFIKGRDLPSSVSPRDFMKKTAPEKVKSTSKYSVGDLVVHTTYGEGMVVSLNADVGKICFTKDGLIKTFDMMHHAIKKLEK